MGIYDDATKILGFGSVAESFNLYKQINQVKIDNAFARSQNTINELNASASLQRLNNDAVRAPVNNGMLNPFAGGADMKKYLGYGLLAAAGLATAYLLIKK